MYKEKGGPILTDEFLEEAAKEINQLYGGHTNEQNVESIDND